MKTLLATRVRVLALWITGAARQPTIASLAPGIIAGLYLGRLLSEILTGLISPAQFLILEFVTLLLVLSLAHLLRRFWIKTWPFSILFLYVVWGKPWQALALSLLFVTFIALIFINIPLSTKRHPPSAVSTWGSRPVRHLLGMGPEVAIFLGTLTLYVYTLAPTVLPADSGEFQLVGAVLGIAHPPGYPLYTLLARLSTLLPLGDMAYRVNLFSAVCSALTLAVIARSVRRITGSTPAGLVAAGFLGLSTTYWVQSTTANIRIFTALLTALSVTTLWRWSEAPTRRHLMAFALCFGLGVGHHPSIGLLGLPFVAYILARSPRLVLQPRQWIPPLLGFMATFLVLLYLPLRSLMSPSFDPAPIRSWADLANHVLALGFGGDLFYFRTWPEIGVRLGIWGEILWLQFGPLLLVSALLAVYPMARRHGWGLALLGGVWLANTLAAVTYRAPQTVEYLIPSYVALTLLLGCGLGTFLSCAALPRLVGAGLVAGLALAVIWNGLANYPSMSSMHNDLSARNDAQAVLQASPTHALILASWHRATVFWYLQQVEGLRPDVEVRYVYPEGATANEEVWLRRIAAAMAERPVIVTNRFYAYEHTPYRWLALHTAWLVQRTDQPIDVPPQLSGQEELFAEGIRVLGYQLVTDTVHPGETLDLQVYWQPTLPLARDYSTFAQLLGPSGVVGQGDIAHRSREYRPGEVQVDTYRFPLLLHAAPGTYRLITGFYYQADNGWQRLSARGDDYLSLATVTVLPASAPMATLHPQEVTYANGLRLTGIDYDRTVLGQLRLYLHWYRPTAILQESSAAAGSPSIRVVRPDGLSVTQGSIPDLPPGTAATIALDVPDDLAHVSLSMISAEGAPVARLGAWHRPAGVDLPLALPRETVHYVPLGGKMAFVGMQSPTVGHPGQTLWLRPHFLALQPLTTDDTVSVGLQRRDPDWEIKTDGTPALGAIPTLKWVRGWLVSDPHPLQLPANAPYGAASQTLSVYDAFTLEPLIVLDERLVRLGQGTYLSLGSLTIASR
jgi:4-amino-4-deoxy-L-arabinose transferase-like glycosyltransferase